MWRLVLVSSLLPTLALADGASHVIGGTAAPVGKWPDVAAIEDATMQQFCTGTLIGKNLVITAGHCNGTDLVNILIGTNSLSHPELGEVIAVKEKFEYPLSQQSEDVTIVVLAKDSMFEPRKIATGWARLDIKNGAAVQLVGYGSTDKDGNVYIPELQEATSMITDFDCTTSKGCNGMAMPDGELGAGGGGIDTCPGDSGGPMYLLTDYGTFLAGVTSRGYSDAVDLCGRGGIYERPDKIVAWIETTTGFQVAHGPEPMVGDLSTTRGAAGETTIVTNDPKTEEHTFTVTTAPKYGTVKIRDDGVVRFCADPGVAGEDAMTVAIADAHDATRTLSVAIAVHIADGTPPESCSVDAFSDGKGSDGGGCCSTGRGAGSSVPLALGVLVALRRRRRC